MLEVIGGLVIWWTLGIIGRVAYHYSELHSEWSYERNKAAEFERDFSLWDLIMGILQGLGGVIIMFVGCMAFLIQVPWFSWTLEKIRGIKLVKFLKSKKFR